MLVSFPEEGKVEIPVTVKKFHYDNDWDVLERSDGSVFPQTIPEFYVRHGSKTSPDHPPHFEPTGATISFDEWTSLQLNPSSSKGCIILCLVVVVVAFITLVPS